MHIINKHGTPLVLPNGQELVPNIPTPVEDWDRVKKNAAVTAWFKAGIIAEAKSGSKVVLLGTDSLPSELQLVEGVTVQLGDVVGHAFKASGLDEAAWNSLPQQERDDKLSEAVAEMRNEAEADKAGGGDKAELIAQLEAAKVKYDKRWGVDKLREALATAAKAEG